MNIHTAVLLLLVGLACSMSAAAFGPARWIRAVGMLGIVLNGACWLRIAGVLA